MKRDDNMAILLALIPIMMIFICLFLFKQTSLRSFNCLRGVCWNRFTSPTFQLGISETVHATIKGSLICFIVGYVCFSVFFISPHEQNGVHRPSSTFLEEVTHDRLLQMLLMCFGICPLIESVSGFGIGFMVAAPIFLSLGYKPFQAVLLSFIGLLASSWGQWQLVQLSVRNLSICLLQHSVQIQRY